MADQEFSKKESQAKVENENIKEGPNVVELDPIEAQRDPDVTEPKSCDEEDSEIQTIVVAKTVEVLQDQKLEIAEPLLPSFLTKLTVWFVAAYFVGLSPFLWELLLRYFENAPEQADAQYRALSFFGKLRTGIDTISPKGEIVLLAIALLGDTTGSLFLVKPHCKAAVRFKWVIFTAFVAWIVVLGVIYGLVATSDYTGTLAKLDQAKYLLVLNDSFIWVTIFCIIGKSIMFLYESRR
ncbi:MAG: hypothetical protein AAF609_24875 [Cyanobacteria bacterium P01_C01_bin.120]